MTPGKLNLSITRGSSFKKVLRWETGAFAYKTITAVPSLAPLRLTVPGHELPSGWRFAVQSVKGMTQLNAVKSPPADSDYYKGISIDGDTIEVNSVNAMDFGTYTTGGVVLYKKPMDFNGYTARMTIKDKIGGTELLSLTTENNRIELLPITKTIELLISAADTELITFSKGVYDLELVSSSGEVTKLLTGSIKVIGEVTT